MGPRNIEEVNIASGKQGARISVSLILQIAAFLVMFGYTWASFQTKADAKQEIRDAQALYMPRELSDERWKTNGSDHRRLEKKLDAIMERLKIPPVTEDAK